MEKFDYKCDICGKEFQSDEEKEQFIVCGDCQKALNSDSVEVGDDDGNS